MTTGVMSQLEQFTGAGPWPERLSAVMEMMREMSRQSDPQEMVAAYGRRVAQFMPVDRRISLSRRNLAAPHFRVTRYSEWGEAINPWKEADRLPVLSGGLLGELLYGSEPRIIDDLHVEGDDPAAEYLAGQRSLMAIPMLDQGVALNMVVVTRAEPQAFDHERLPEHVWLANLFGRATHNLVLADQVRTAYELVDRELQVVADIQQSLLPACLPEIPSLKLAAHYQTSRRAGGDYYDFFRLPDDRWGILIADVSGHGTPAAVVMAITHSIAHMYPGTAAACRKVGLDGIEWPADEAPADAAALAASPGRLLTFINRHLTARYTSGFGAFVTAFYGIYDPRDQVLTYSSAGHNPPRIRRCTTGEVVALGGTRNFPLGIMADETYADRSYYLSPGDQIIFYTDGLTETHNPQGELFGTDRLDAVLAKCTNDPAAILDSVLTAVDQFADGLPPADDRTLIAAKVL